MIIEAAFAVRTVQSTLSFANSFSHKSHFYFLVNYTVTEVESLIYTAFFNQECTKNAVSVTIQVKYTA